MKKIFTILLVILLLCTLSACSDQALTRASSNIQVTGSGKVTTVPDTVQISFTVISEGKDKNVQEENSVKTQKMIDALLALGLKKDELETQNVSFTPMYRWDEKDGQQLIGYRAENTLLVKTKALDKSGSIIDTAVKNGADLVGSLNFSLSDEAKEQIIGLAIDQAVKDARDQAELTAAAAGTKIKGIQTLQVIKESSAPPIYYDMQKGMGVSAASSTTPVIPDEAILNVLVQAVYIIES